MTNETKQTGQEVAVTRKEKEGDMAMPVAPYAAFDEMERMFERLMPRGWLRPFRMGMDWRGDQFGLRVPSIDVIDKDNDVVVRAELPGVEKGDIDITTTGKTLSINAKSRKETKEERGGDFYRCEISQSSWGRTIMLPGSVDPDQVKATLKDGILEVTLAKTNGDRRHHVVIE